MKNLIVLLIVMPLMVSCATLHETPMSDSMEISSDRIFKQELLTPSADRNIKVTIIRDTGHAGSYASYFFKIDKRKVCEFYQSEIVTIYLSKGEYLFTTEMGNRGHGSYRTFNEEYFTIESDIVFRLTLDKNATTKLIQ